MSDLDLIDVTAIDGSIRDQAHFPWDRAYMMM